MLHGGHKVDSLILSSQGTPKGLGQGKTGMAQGWGGRAPHSGLTQEEGFHLRHQPQKA